MDPASPIDVIDLGQPPPIVCPDWSAVTDDVPCPLCEYNLRGVAEPRCPECGYRFDWPDLLDADRRIPPFLYEHHLGQRRRAFFRTLRAGLRPYRFWSTLKASHPLRPHRLLCYWLLQSIVPLMLLLLSLGAYVGMHTRRHWIARQVERATLAKPEYAPFAQAAINQYGSVENYLDAVYPVVPWKVLKLFGGPWRVVQGSLTIPAVILLWPAVTLAALCIFEITMKRAKIKRLHVLRCVVYSADVAWWVGLAVLLLAPIVVATRSPGTPWGLVMTDEVDMMVFALCWVGLVIFTIRLHAAYRRYLRFPHAGWVVLSSQLIALLTTLNLILWATKRD